MKNLIVKFSLVLLILALPLSLFSSGSKVANGTNYTVSTVQLVSPVASTILPKDQVAGVNEQVYLSVKLADSSGVPVSGHKVKLISSSGEDSIENLSTVSDASGKVDFRITSPKTGIVTYIAYDAKSDVIVSNRGKIVFFDSNEYIFSNAVKDFSYAAVGNSTAVDHFEFEDVPSSISTNQAITFKLSAVDFQKNVVPAYSGKVRFSVIGSNAFYADLPPDYTFTAQDLGSHTFSLALNFKQTGAYLVEARDLTNNAISGEYTFIVGGGAGANQSSSEIEISSPVAGTYSNNIQTITGSATPGSKVKIFDNDLEIATVIGDITGSFSYTTSALSDGKHKFYAAMVNEVGTIVAASKTVEITVDTGAPEVSQVAFEPATNIAPGSQVKVKLFSQEKLSQAALVFQNNIYELTDSGQGFYQGSVVAPQIAGDYPVSFVIVDQLGNETRLDNASVMKVGSGGAQVALVDDVTGLKVVSADHRVTLNWSAPNGAVKNYRVYYGLSPTQLSEVVDTFTNATTWYIPNLKNGTEYYFAVTAVDEKGNTSAHFSNIVSAVPNPAVGEVVSPEVTAGVAGQEVISEMPKDPSESGPEVLWVVAVSLMGGYFYIQTGKKKAILKEKVDSIQMISESRSDVRENLRDCLFK